jgi:hypothetical protein
MGAQEGLAWDAEAVAEQVSRYTDAVRRTRPVRPV